jgi:hypothetical protein
MQVGHQYEFELDARGAHESQNSFEAFDEVVRIVIGDGQWLLAREQQNFLSARTATLSTYACRTMDSATINESHFVGKMFSFDQCFDFNEELIFCSCCLPVITI